MNSKYVYVYMCTQNLCALSTCCNCDWTEAPVRVYLRSLIWKQVVLMSGKLIVLESNFWKLQNYALLKSSIFCDTTSYSRLEVNRRFGGTCWIHLQGWRGSQQKATWSRQSRALPLYQPVRLGDLEMVKWYVSTELHIGSVVFMLVSCLVALQPWIWRQHFFRNIDWLSTDCMALYHGR
jgi:hypothetical protein